ncbi:ribonuclease H-like domain-containing protein [Tanacetum coccineum]
MPSCMVSLWAQAGPSGLGNDIVYLLLYVDDIVLTASSKTLLQHIIASLHQEFSMIDLGSLNYFLGISVTWDSFGMFLSLRKYDVEILERAHMVNCNPSRTPVDTESKLGDDVQQICLYMHDPREPHFSALKRMLRYVRGTLDYGLQLFSSSTTSSIAYLDADWAGPPTTRRSTFGYSVFFGNNLLSCSSKRQPTLSRSSAEAKYRGVANVVAETCWLRNLLRELHTPLSFAMLVYCDNISVVYLSSNLYADIFTKGLPFALFQEFRTSLSVRCPLAQTTGESRLDQLVITLASGDIGQGFDPHSLQGRRSFSTLGRTRTSLSTLGRGKAIYVSTSPIHRGRRY